MSNFSDAASVASYAIKETGEFTSGLIHSVIENPYNGLAQIANRTGAANLPEMHIVSPDAQSTGAMLGSITGSAIDYYLLNKGASYLMGNLGGNGLGGAMLRGGIVGAAYEGLLTPSDMNSDHFFRDRLASSAVGFTTFAAMTGAGAMLDKTGVFAVPEARSFMGSITYGGAAGTLGGVAHAEANAIFRNGSAVPAWKDLGSDVANYAMFGAAFGALGYANTRVDQAINDRSITIKSDAARGQSRVDKARRPVSSDRGSPRHQRMEKFVQR